jgi:hypothetical protein
MVGRPLRPVIAVELGDGAGEAADLGPALPVFPLLTTDPRFLRGIDRSVLPTAVEVHPAPIPGGLRVEIALRHLSEPQNAPFGYVVQDGIARKEDRE